MPETGPFATTQGGRRDMVDEAEEQYIVVRNVER